MIKAKGIILGSPVYFTDVTAEVKVLMDRAGFVSMGNGAMYKNKVEATVVAVRRSGAIHTLDTMNHFFLAGQMIVIGRGIGVGRDKGEVEKDEEGLQAVEALGQRMAWLIKKLQG
jgi:multimeric flavodoxin WrbA